ncbi:MAG TPA: carboxypeptidase-like regulatory domain-containing protein, partial [Terriglobales bacterium]|nr:carboxypeptidase-like regulatory domain-containing protein [Terriglobales bacterium]
MPGKFKSHRYVLAVAFVVLACGTALAQFTSSVQGTVEDPTGAGVAKANVQLVNVSTSATQVTTTDSGGN